jgi:hypothetical protein
MIAISETIAENPEKTSGPLKRRILKSIHRLPLSEKTALLKTDFFRSLYPGENIEIHERNDILMYSDSPKNSQLIFNL